MNEIRVLIIDDDKTLTELLAEHLESTGYKATVANNAKEGLEIALDEIHNIVILDVMMPVMDGLEVCQRIRESSSIPIIMLSAKGEEFDKLRGFQLGVDDYVTKPFSFAELGARIKAVTSRSKKSQSNLSILALENLSIDLEERKITLEGNTINLTPTEYKLLEALAKSHQRTVPTEALLAQVWGEAYTGEIEHVKHYIWSLRNKIEKDPGDPKHIITERGFGYRLE